jgi:hypothetical protein
MKWMPRKVKEDNLAKCINENVGCTFMKSHYDNLSRKVRNRLANSPFNICPACFNGRLDRGWGWRGRGKPLTDADFFRCIEIVEQKLRGGRR